MRHSLSFPIAVTALFAVGAAIAAPVTDVDLQRAAKRAEFRQQAFDRIDTNHDGKIDRDEYKAMVDARFDRLDANHDGVVDADELANSPAAKERASRKAEHAMQRFDGSGKVSKADFEAKSMQRFDRLAAGGDSISAEQFAASRHHHRHDAKR